MHGLNCGRCYGERGPYLTAYEIALKHGYEGSEEEWIETVQSIFVARVTSNNEVSWECDTSYEELLAMDEVKLTFEEEALRSIASRALEQDTGARALRSIIEAFMLDIMYEIPKDDSIGEVVITRAYVEGSGGPRIMMRG